MNEISDMLKLRLVEINKLLGNRGITGNMADKIWNDWVGYCEVMGYNVFNGGVNNE